MGGEKCFAIFRNDNAFEQINEKSNRMLFIIEVEEETISETLFNHY